MPCQHSANTAFSSVGSMTPTMRERWARSLAPSRLGRKPSSPAACNTRPAVSWRTSSGLLNTREAVASDTPAALATLTRVAPLEGAGEAAREVALRRIRQESGSVQELVQEKMKTFSFKPQKNGCQGQPLVRCAASQPAWLCKWPGWPNEGHCAGRK
ncbi:protein of unknown function [Cupriavidus taiwanensis]|nr:protein of unknown function [Cupriavidus taiwanensis]